MPKVKCLRMIANRLAGETIATEADDTICKVLRKMGTNLNPIPDDNELLHDVSDVVFKVTITQNEDQTYSCDKTIAEIMEADAAGMVIVGYLGAYRLQPAQISSVLCYFYSEVMASATVSQRASVAITADSVGVVYINHELVPPEVA